MWRPPKDGCLEKPPAHHGRGVAVVLSLQSFEDPRAAAARSALRRAVDDAERDIAEGRFVDHEAVRKKLQRWASGEG